MTQYITSRPPNRRIQIREDIRQNSNSQHIRIHLIGVHYRHRVSLSVVIGEVELLVGGVLYDVFDHGHALLEEMLGIGLFAVLSDEVAVYQREVFGGDVFHELAGCGVTGKPESQ